MKNTLLFVLGLLMAVWFTLAGMVWIYWMAPIIAYPFGIGSFFIWRAIKTDGLERNIAIPIILEIGLSLSLGMLLYLAIFD